MWASGTECSLSSLVIENLAVSVDIDGVVSDNTFSSSFSSTWRSSRVNSCGDNVSEGEITQGEAVVLELTGSWILVAAYSLSLVDLLSLVYLSESLSLAVDHV